MCKRFSVLPFFFLLISLISCTKEEPEVNQSPKISLFRIDGMEPLSGYFMDTTRSRELSFQVSDDSRVRNYQLSLLRKGALPIILKEEIVNSRRANISTDFKFPLLSEDGPYELQIEVFDNRAQSGRLSFPILIAYPIPILNINYLRGPVFAPGEQIELIGSVEGRVKISQVKADILINYDGSGVLLTDSLFLPDYKGTKYELPPWSLEIPKNAPEGPYFLRVAAEDVEGRKKFQFFNIGVSR